MVSERSTAADLRREFPSLWRMAEQYDFAERLGGCMNAMYAEADAALRELWMARENLKSPQTPLISMEAQPLTEKEGFEPSLRANPHDGRAGSQHEGDVPT